MIGENGLLKQLAKLLVERSLDAKISEYLKHHKSAHVTDPDGKARNCKSKKTLKGEFRELPIKTPRNGRTTSRPS